MTTRHAPPSKLSLPCLWKPRPTTQSGPPWHGVMDCFIGSGMHQVGGEMCGSYWCPRNGTNGCYMRPTVRWGQDTTGWPRPSTSCASVFTGLVAGRTQSFSFTAVPPALLRRGRLDVPMPLCSNTRRGPPWSGLGWTSWAHSPPQIAGTATSSWQFTISLFQ